MDIRTIVFTCVFCACILIVIVVHILICVHVCVWLCHDCTGILEWVHGTGMYMLFIIHTHVHTHIHMYVYIYTCTHIVTSTYSFINVCGEYASIYTYIFILLVHVYVCM